MPIIDVDGCSIHVEIEGRENAPVLVLSNSLGTDLRMWDSQVGALGNRYRLIRYDCRGHGRSGVPQGPYRIEHFGRDIMSVMDALKVSRFSWCGVSMSGMIGQWLAANVPERIEKLILSNTTSFYHDQSPWNERIRIAEECGLEALANAIMDRWFTADFREKVPDEVARVRRMFVATPVPGYVASCAAIREIDFRASNSAVTVPTLVIVGMRDPATPPDDGKLIHQQIKGSKLVTLDAAHISSIEQPTKYAQAVLDFLEANA